MAARIVTDHGFRRDGTHGARLRAGVSAARA